ncbi:TonB-dependent receptor domain-containing protein [Umboniibacter marinipuniceus]|uniref:TonB-dependent receptor n=1 Tax=Umboniibacter marinipuniceus TaxID=569599 RepID=A0A3M0AAW5_9GAMM|nr:TonB-dependent receptor [Umboniibacter marinipuniceus]RMA82303.1 TonB-dependent receptor [Umboniibacter marinipuniceus]
MKPNLFTPSALASAIALALLSSPAVMAQTGFDPERPAPIEEVLVTGRQRDAAEQLIVERIEESHQVDILSAETISRAGDSDLAAALRRVPGLTLLGGKYVYVRGLGERYSSTQLNGAQVPSPDFSRNVLPLDIFPTDIIDSMVIQKSYSADLPAAFGGGNINIRTKGIPDDFVLNLELSSGFNSSSKDGFTNSNGGDSLGAAADSMAFPSAISQGLTDYRGDLSVSNIFATLRSSDISATRNDAVAINQSYAASLDRQFAIQHQSLDPDRNAKLALGNNFFLSDDLEIGFLALAGQENKWRNKHRMTKNWAQPNDIYTDTQRTVNEISLTGAFNVGLRYTNDHQLLFSSLFLRNTEDETRVAIGNDLNTILADGNREREWATRYEQRELFVNQVRGSHRFDDTLFFARLGAGWYYSDATATSDVPGEVSVLGLDSLTTGGELVSSAIRSSSSVASFNWTRLDDEVESYGWEFEAGDELGDSEWTISGGYDYWLKVRHFEYLPTNISTAGVQNAADLRDSGDVLTLPDRIFDDASLLDVTSGLGFRTGGIGSESYVAFLESHAGWGSLDVQLSEAWRLNAGVRWEEYTQFSLPYDSLNYSDDPVGLSEQEIVDSFSVSDDWYPSLALTYSNGDFLGAETFQVRTSVSQTVVRPDLREVSDATYIDTVTEFRVVGNPLLEPSDLTNADLRFEWFFENGDSLTSTLFYKDISAPIEAIQRPGSDDNLVIGFVNADSAEVYGVEFEMLKDLSQLSSGLFVSGNLTLSDSEIQISQSDIGLTNNTRRMNGHSEWVANAALGYDSDGGLVSANMVYNIAGERLVFAGRAGAPDAYEQPFNSLDLNVDVFPLEALRVRFKVQNLLDEKVTFAQGDTTIVEQTVGSSYSLGLRYEF